jgi:lipopolysaccharide transport system permease protein
MFNNFAKYRNLFSNLLSNELKDRYKHSFLGFLWTLIEPALIILILIFVFSNLFKNDMNLFVPYLITGFIIWFFFINGVSLLDVFVSKANIITKIKFPIEIVIFSSFSSVLILSLIMILILIMILLFLGINLSITIMFLPFLIVLQSLFTLGFLFLLSTLYVFFRDTRQIWNVLSQAWFFATPVMYPTSLLEDKAPLLLKLNPMAYFISSYRDVLVYNLFPNINDIFILILISLLTFALGYFIFYKAKDKIREEV